MRKHLLSTTTTTTAAAFGLAAALLSTSVVCGNAAPQADAILKMFADEFILLTPGQGRFPPSFVMGSDKDSAAAEQPAHKVTFTTPFALARYEVTQELYQTVLGKNPSKWKGPRNSVEMVSWSEANDFCRKATAELRRLKLLKGHEIIRLPSEAEWEYACRAGTTTRFSFGDDVSQLTDYAWYDGNAKGNDPPVGKKLPNAWGLYDMHGYVAEWCADAWHPNYDGAPTDGSAWQGKKSDKRVVRGGSWAHGAGACRCAARMPLAADFRGDAVGFRCARAAQSSTKKGG